MKEIEKELGKIRNLYRREKRLLERLNEFRLGLLPSGIRYDRDKVMTSPEDQMLIAFANIDYVELELMDIQREIMLTRKELSVILYRLPVKERTVLMQYYILCRPIQSIADQLNVTRRHVFRLKNNGIYMLREIEVKKNDKA